MGFLNQCFLYSKPSIQVKGISNLLLFPAVALISSKYIIIIIINILKQMQAHEDFFIPKQPYFHQKIKTLELGDKSISQVLSEIKKKQRKTVVISGFPYDEGTRRNGGRVGGAIAPQIFRKGLQSQMYLWAQVGIYDSGDIKNQMELEIAHEELYKKHREILGIQGNIVLFSIGGSNDQSYPNVRALLQTYPNSKIGVINLDAHFDVRPLKQGKAHSGSPFRQMLQNQIFVKNQSIFVEFANKGATCSNEHRKYLDEKGAKIYWLQKDIRTFQLTKQSQYSTQAGQLFLQILTQLHQQVQHIFISFDTDSINSKYMPGVSAPSVVGGLSSAQAIQIMKISGLESKVKLVDFSEFNPAVQSLVSSKMLAEMFYAFVSAYGDRQAEKQAE